MRGNIFINLIAAAFGFLLVFFVSLSANTLSTSAIRGVTSALLFFIFFYPVRLLFTFALKDTTQEQVNESSNLNENKDEKESNDDNIKNESVDIPDIGQIKKSDDDFLQSFDENEVIKRTSQYVKDLIDDE